MWNSKRSALLSLIFVYGFSVVFLALVAAAPWAVKWFIALYCKNTGLQTPLVAFVYTSLLPVGYALSLLRQLCKTAYEEQCFCSANVTRLRHLSWCCFVVAAVTFGYGFFYTPLLLMTPFIAFVGLIVRVIKNAFHTALELQTENQLTI